MAALLLLDSARAHALMQTLFVSAVLVLAFLLGSFLMIRLGRRAARPGDEGPRKTPYVDAWSRYRLTDQEIDDITGPSGNGPEPPAEPGPSEPEPPPRGPSDGPAEPDADGEGPRSGDR